MRDEYRRIVREKHRRRVGIIDEDVPAPDESADREVERLAGQLQGGNQLLTRNQQAAVIAYMNRKPGQELREVAALAGYAFPCSLSAIVARAVTRIRTLLDNAPIAA